MLGSRFAGIIALYVKQKKCKFTVKASRAEQKGENKCKKQI